MKKSNNRQFTTNINTLFYAIKTYRFIILKNYLRTEFFAGSFLVFSIMINDF